MNPIAALLFFITVVNLFLGSLVFFRNRKSPLHLSLSVFIFLVAAWMLSMGIFYQVESIGFAFFWIKWVYIFGIVIANTLVYFSLVFPKGIEIPLKQRFLVYAPSIPLIAAILFMPNFLFQEIIFHSWWKDVILGTWEYTLYTIYFVTVYFGAIAILFRKYLSYRGKLQLQVAYVLCAVFIAGSFGAIFDLLFPWVNLYKYIWLGPIGTLIMVSIFVYAIVKHRFLDIRIIVARAITYSLLALILAAIYAFGLFGIGSLLVELTSSISRLVISIILSLIMAFSFQPLRQFLEAMTDQIFFKGNYNSDRLLSKLSTIMSTNIELEILCREILDTLTKQIRITRGAFVILAEEQTSIYHTVDVGFPNKLNVSIDQISAFFPFAETMVFDELEENHLKNLMRELDTSIVKTLMVKNQVIGLLILGEKLSGEVYSDKDLKVLEILAPEIAVAIQNSQSYDKIKRFNIVLSDEVKKATFDLQNANERLKETDQLKDDFVSVASHELRTPMTAIRSYAWMALHKSDIPLSQKLERYLYRTLISTERLINLVNDMLNVSRIESGKIEINPKTFDIVALVKEVVEEVKAKADEKRLQLTVLEHKLPSVFADADKVHQILLNLIGNSLKFCYPGGNIMVDFFTDGRMVEVSIKDTGLGITKGDLGKLFHKFARLDNSYVSISTSGGTGLGLYISKSLVELMHGKIWAESEGVDLGANFTFSLPVASQAVLDHQDDFRLKAQGEVKPLEPFAL